MTILLLLLASSLAHADSCQEIQGVLDIGSGSVKAVAAEVDVCKKEIVRTVYEGQAPMACNEVMEKSADQTLPPSFLDEATAKVQPLVKAMQDKHATRINGLATSCYRLAKNGADVATSLGNRLGVPVKVITQDEEAELGYLAAMSARKVPLTEQARVVVWDIGGGSMQMRAESEAGTQLYKGELASVSFKNRVIEEIEKKNSQETLTPNPLGKNWRRAVQLAEKEAKSVPAFFRQEKAGRRWIGISGVLAHSVQEQVRKGGTSFTPAEVERTLQKRAKLTDDKIGGDYATTEVTNLALVLGYLKALHIRKVETAKVSNAQGFLTLQLFNPLRDAAPAKGFSATSTGTSTATELNREPAHP